MPRHRLGHYTYSCKGANIQLLGGGGGLEFFNWTTYLFHLLLALYQQLAALA